MKKIKKNKVYAVPVEYLPDKSFRLPKMGNEGQLVFFILLNYEYKMNGEWLAPCYVLSRLYLAKFELTKSELESIKKDAMKIHPKDKKYISDFVKTIGKLKLDFETGF